MSIILTLSVAILGWGVGFVSSIISSRLLDRRRAFQALIGEIESVRSEIRNLADFQDVHDRSVISLKPLVFHAIPFLNEANRKDARRIWEGYRDIKICDFLDDDIMGNLAKFYAPETGELATTKQEALDMVLSRLEATFPCLWL